MYAFVNGRLDSIEDGAVVIDNNGIGYYINCSNNTIVQCGNIGNEVKLYTKLIVREDDMSLCGFYSIEERRMFEQLTSISGVGVKMALQILSSCSIKSLILAIVNSDVKVLTQAKGIGKKVAERIILELREKVDITDIVGVSDVGASRDVNIKDSAVNDAVMALVSLGYSKTEALNSVLKAREKTVDVNGLITLALRSMDR